MGKFKFPLNPYNDDKNLYTKGTVTIQDGITILVGANGTGKTTFLSLLKQKLRDNNIPVITFDNLKEGGTHNVEKFFAEGNISYGAEAMIASEGENIYISVSMFVKTLGEFIRNGVSKIDRLSKAIKNLNEKSNDDEPIVDERWILIDGIDSGLSIDNIVDIKTFFHKIVDEEKQHGLKVNIIISANEYEMVNGEQCLDVRNMQYREFKTYDSYKKFILKSRQEKDTRFH